MTKHHRELGWPLALLGVLAAGSLDLRAQGADLSLIEAVKRQLDECTVVKKI